MVFDLPLVSHFAAAAVAADVAVASVDAALLEFSNHKTCALPYRLLNVSFHYYSIGYRFL